MVGQSYSYTFDFRLGGLGFSVQPFPSGSIIAGSLPPGLSFGSLFGFGGWPHIQGTPTTAGTYTFRIRFQGNCESPGILGDSVSEAGEGDVTIVVLGSGQPSIVTASPLPDGTVGAAYSQTLQATGGTTPYSWSEIIPTGGASGLPPGLALTQAAGSNDAVISGMPTSAGTFGAINIQLAEAATPPAITSRIFSIQVNNPVPAIVQISRDTATAGAQGFDLTIDGSGFLPVSEVLWNGAPRVATFVSPTRLSAAILASDLATQGNAQIQVRNPAPGGGTSNTLGFTITPAPGQLTITTAALPNGIRGFAYASGVQATGGVAPLTFSVSAGTLPPGLNLDASTGALAGNPSAGGQYDFTVQVQDSGNPQQLASQAYTVLVIQITNVALPDGIIGQPYSHTLSVIGQVSPSTWSVFGGSVLPTGFTLSTAGTLSGTPSATGTFLFSIQVTDSDTPPRTAAEAFTLTINNPAPVMITLTPSSATAGGAAFTLTVDGTDFVSGAEVHWNGVNRPTTFVNSTQLTAQITAADITTAGNAQVTVVNPAPGGGPSNALAFTILAPPVPGGNAGVTDLVSQSTAGVPANSFNATAGGQRKMGISRDGNRVVFQSEATNLDFPHAGVFVRDIGLGITRRVSSTILDATPDGNVGESVSISADGFLVAFQSRASNHVAGDSGQSSDVFVVHTCIQQLPVICPSPERISVLSDGSAPLTGESLDPSLSADGRFVAFSSNSALTGFSNGQSQIFVRDRQSNVTILISADAMGNLGAGSSLLPAISGDGRYVAFVSEAANLVSNDTNGEMDVFVADTCFNAPSPCTPGAITRVSVAGGGAEANGTSGFMPAISEDGRFVVFASLADNLDPGDTNGAVDVFLHDRLTASTTRIMSGPTAGGINATISQDGRYVAFETSTNPQIYVQDTCFNTAPCTPSVFLVSRVLGGAGGDPGSDQPFISGNGQFVVFHTMATNLWPVNAGVTPIFRARTN
jgi:Tol biopolymer transport system component